MIPALREQLPHEVKTKIYKNALFAFQSTAECWESFLFVQTVKNAGNKLEILVPCGLNV